MDNFTYSYYTNSNKLRLIKPLAGYPTLTLGSGNIVPTNKLYSTITIKEGATVANNTNVVLKATEAIEWDVADNSFFDLANSVANNKSFRAYIIGESEGAFNYACLPELQRRQDAIGNLVSDLEQDVKIQWSTISR